MCFNIKCLLALFTMVFISCATDTGVSADFYSDTALSSSSYDTSSLIYSSSSKTPDIEKHYFPTDLVCIGIYKNSNGATLIMQNNTAYKMSVKVNYTISCSVNGKAAETTTETLLFNFNKYEQKESSNIVNVYWFDGNTRDCAGTITSIIPDYYDESNFQAWTGSYHISFEWLINNYA